MAYHGNGRKRTRGVGFHPDSVRKLIQVQKIVERLQKFFLETEDKNGNKITMTREQLRAAEILLSKCIPNLVAVEPTADITYRYVAELPPMLSKDEWLQKYQNEMPVLELPVLPKNGNGSGNLQ